MEEKIGKGINWIKENIKNALQIVGFDLVVFCVGL